MKITIEQMQTVCDSDYNVHRPLFNAPFIVEMDGEDWTVATDGRRMLAVRGVVEGAAVIPNAPVPSIVKMFVAAYRPEGVTAHASVLREFFAENEPSHPSMCATCKDKREEVCPDCDGEGEEECECDCGHVHGSECRSCHGIGTWTCRTCADVRAPVKVRIGPAVFDARVCAPATHLLPDEMAHVRVPGPTDMTTVSGAGWFVAIMPMRADASECPTLELQAVAA